MSDPNRTYRTADWAGESSARWVAAADQLEAQLAPVLDVLFSAASLQPGERVLDVGCGRGASTRRAAELVGPDGAVTGLDVSAALLAAAAELPSVGAPIEWVEGDGQRVALHTEAVDVLLSRFGVMFFDDAAAAMANLSTSVRPGGRLAVAVWSRREHNEMMQWPLEVALVRAAELGHALALPDPTVGPFSWHDPAFVAEVLEGAGWTDVTHEVAPMRMHLGGPASAEDAAETSFAVGPLRTALSEDGVPPQLEPAIRDALVAAYRDRHDGTGVPVEAKPVIVTARKP